jgi:hypothetical protein
MHARMSNFRAVLLFAVIGTLLGIVVATLAAPSLMSTELCGFGANVKLASPCTDTVAAATAGLIRYQLIGAAAGTIGGIALGIFFNVRRGKKKTDAGGGSASTSLPS